MRTNILISLNLLSIALIITSSFPVEALSSSEPKSLVTDYYLEISPFDMQDISFATREFLLWHSSDALFNNTALDQVRVTLLLNFTDITEPFLVRVIFSQIINSLSGSSITKFVTLSINAYVNIEMYFYIHWQEYFDYRYDRFGEDNDYYPENTVIDSISIRFITPNKLWNHSLKGNINIFQEKRTLLDNTSTLVNNNDPSFSNTDITNTEIAHETPNDLLYLSLGLISIPILRKTSLKDFWRKNK